MDALLVKYIRLFAERPCEGRDYYALTLAASENGAIEYGCQTHWVGYSDDKPPREVREASIMHADRVLEAWRMIGEPGLVVNDVDGFLLYFAFGGHAVVEKSVAESLVPEWLAPSVMVNVGRNGFASPKLVGKDALNKAPTPKKRMAVIRRDSYRCRVCGRGPNDHTDVQLHVHHIRPWACGGVTEESNLITLCHTCHIGLDPHFNPDLFEMLEVRRTPTERTKVYAAGLLRYQHLASLQIQERQSRVRSAHGRNARRRK